MISLLRYPGLQSHWKVPGVFLQVPFPHTSCVIPHSSMSRVTKKVLTIIQHNRFDLIPLTRRLTVALDPMLVQGESLIALAAVAANSVLAPAVQAHPRKLDALVDVLLLREPRSSRTQLVVRGGVRLGTGLASFAAPSATHRTAAEALGEVSLYGAGALPVAVLHVAGLLSRVYASGV